MILNHLWTILQMDSSKADAGLVKMQKKTDDLVKELDEMDKTGGTAFGNLAVLATKLVSAIAAAGTVVKTIGAVNTLAQQTADLGDMADNLDINISKLDMFQKAMYATGGTAEGALGTINMLTQRLGKGFSDANGPISETLNKLGIGLRDSSGNAKDAIDIITDLSGTLQKMTRPEAFSTLRQLGITDPKVIENILKGRKELEELYNVEKKRGLIGEQELIRAKKLTDAQDRFRATVSRLSDAFLGRLIPVMSAVVDWLEKMVNWAGEHKDVIVGFFTAIATVVAVVYLPVMVAMAAATIAASLPLILMATVIAAVAAAFALAYEDVMAFIDGNDSLIGQIFDNFPKIKELVYMVIDAFKFMGETIVNTFSTVWETLKSIFTFISDGISKVVSAFSKLPFASMMTDALSGEMTMAGASSNPMNARTSPAIANGAGGSTSNNVQIGQMTIETKATDAKGIAKDAKSELSTQLRDLQTENKSAVTR